jgi:hypothetical protein
MSWTPSIVPSDDQNVYLVIDDLGRLGRVWREADVEQADLETVIQDLLEGQYSNPIGVFGFNPMEGWSRDVSDDVARELRRRCDLRLRDGSAAISGVPSGPANAGGLNNSGNDPSGAGNSAKVPTAPGTNTLGTASSSGSTSGGTTGSTTTGMANSRAAGVGTGGRIDGTVTPGPSMPGDAEIRAEDPKVDAKIKSICKGC